MRPAMFYVFGIAIVIIFWVIDAQRRLVTLDENINNALNQINVMLTSRFDALTGLLNLVKGYNEHEYKTLSDTIKMRTSINAQSSSKDIEDQENMITQTLGKIVAVAENYPELKSNANYQNLMNSLNSYEDKVRQSRLVYNDNVTKLNRQIRKFPTSIIAPMLHVSQREYLKQEEGKQSMPSMA